MQHAPEPAVPRPLRIVVADDHQLVRCGVATLLNRMAGMQVVAEAGDWEGLIASVEEADPDIVLTDLGMPGRDGIDGIRELRARRVRAPIVVLSMQDEAETIWRAIAAGASGYVLKRTGSDELERALRTVAAAGQYVSTDASKHLSRLNPSQVLSERQIEVLKLLALGCSAREVGRRLAISTKTVDAHRAAIKRRLGLTDTAGLTRYALRKGLIDNDD